MLFGDMRSNIIKWTREDIEVDIVNDCINDSIEALWEGCIQAKLSEFVGGPVSVTFAAASERLTLVSIADPTVAPVLSQAAGGTLGARSATVAITLVTDSGTETLPSPDSAFAISAANLLHVAAPIAVPSAYGWNLYVGSVTGLKAKQNANPLRFNQSFIEPATGFQDLGSSSPAGPGVPISNTTGDNIFYIRHLEHLTPDNVYKPYNFVDVDSELMRRAARSVPSTSDHQNYWFDLINGEQLEIRPAAGIDLGVRYFFTSKPRRIIYDDARIPFGSVDFISFIRYNSLSLISLAAHEYDSADRWEKKADATMLNTLKSLTQTSWNKDSRVTPFIVS